MRGPVGTPHRLALLSTSPQGEKRERVAGSRLILRIEELIIPMFEAPETLLPSFPLVSQTRADWIPGTRPRMRDVAKVPHSLFSPWGEGARRADEGFPCEVPWEPLIASLCSALLPKGRRGSALLALVSFYGLRS